MESMDSARVWAELSERPLGSGLVPVFIISKSLGHEWTRCLGDIKLTAVPQLSISDIDEAVRAARDGNTGKSVGIAGPEITPGIDTWTWSHMSSSGRVWAWVHSGRFCWTGLVHVGTPLGACLELNLSESLGGLVTAGLAKFDSRHVELFKKLVAPLEEGLDFPGLMEQIDDLINADASVTM